MKKLFYVLTVIAAFLLQQCKQVEKEIVPSPLFASYITAYTGGVISTSGSIRIELARPQSGVELNTPVDEKLFSFSPSLKGQAYWVSPNIIEFVPKEGALKENKLYKAEFRLGRLEKVDKELQTFAFTFRTKAQDFSVEILPGTVTDLDPGMVRFQGRISFSDMVDAAKAVKMLELDGHKVTTIEPSSGSSNMFNFTFEGIQRQPEDNSLVLAVKGKSAGIGRNEDHIVMVPAAGEFKFVDARLISSPENGVCVTFSDPLDTDQDLQGLVSLSGVDDQIMQVEDNKVYIFFDRPGSLSITVSVDPGVRSSAGKTLDRQQEVTLDVEALKPQVEITSKGNIMPDAQNLLLTFRTANLRAVDLKVVRIYQSNVLMFLQSNTINTSSELRRSGRLVYSKPLYLNTRSSDTNSWQEHSVDLAPLINQEPGAIYHIELSMRREYSTYPCGGAAEGSVSQSQGMVQLSADGISEEEEAQWDKPVSYYWDEDYDDYDWEQYNWREREDPCKPSYYMNSDRKSSTNVTASNLGVIIKSGAERKAWVAVSDVLTTLPVMDAQIKVYNFQLQPVGEGKTDAQGLAQVELRGKGFVAVVEKDGWRTYVKMDDNEQNSLSRFDVGGKEIEKGLKGFIYGERGVWRPGDTLHLTFIMEDRAKKIPDSHPVTIELFNPRGQFHTRQVNAQGTNGFYRFDIPTADSDPTGLWNAYVKVGGASFHKSLRVETIKPNRLKISFAIPGGVIDGAKRTAQASLSASWLTGATARNLAAKAEMTLVKGGGTGFKGYERFTFNNPASSFSSEKTEIFDGRLDESGKTSFNINLPTVSDAPGMLRADVVCRVFEPGGDASIFVESFPYNPFQRYVGVDLRQSQNEQFETDKDNTFDVVTLSADGKPVDGKLEYRVYKLRWSWWWHKGDESLASYVNGNYSDPVDEGTITTSGGKGKLSFRVDYPDWGRYLIYIKDAQGGHATGGIVYVDWPSWRGRSSKTDPDGATMLTFSMDKTSYEVGDQATVIIPAAPGGRALVSFENGSTVLESKWVEMAKEGDTKYSFKITPQMAPNFYVHISQVLPHSQTADARPIRLYGIQPVEVNNKDSKLEPVISAPEVLRPQSEFTVKVSEKAGREMTYTLAVVDEGLLDLTNFKTPNPWNSFYSREALGVRTWDMYDYVMGAYGSTIGALLSIGGDEELNQGNRKANRFKPVVRFLGPFTLKKGGSASHKISLPMYVGSVRVMVVAGGGNAYGASEKAIPVRTPLMVLTTLPRTISTGEEIMLPVNVFAMEPDVKQATVKAEASGAAGIIRTSTLTASFPSPGDQTLYFRLRASDVPGVAKIKVTAASGGHKSVEEVEIQVRNPNPAVVMVTDTVLKASGTLTLPYSLGGQPNDENWVKLEVARMPSVDISRRYDYLNDYQHLCSEQLTSRGMPMLYLDQFRDVDSAEATKIKSGVQQIIKLLYSRQLSNGGIAYWPGYTDAQDWITSYAGNFLLEAKRYGYDVNQGVINRWKEYQSRAAKNWSMPQGRSPYDYYYYQSDMVQAYRLYTLALAGSPETGAMNRMKEMKNISVAARWRLAAAYALSGKKAAANEVIANIHSAVEPYNQGQTFTYGSPVRDAAMILEAMVLMDDMTGAMRQARYLSGELSRETYLSTQSTAFSLVAMASLASKIESGQVDFTLSLDGQEAKDVKTAKAVKEVLLPLKKSSGEVTLRSNSRGDLYVTMVTKTRPVVDNMPAMGNGLKLEVVYVDMERRAISIDSLVQGTDFQALVTITNTGGVADYKDLALTHIMPSGWEIFNQRMALSDDSVEQGTGSVRRANYNYQDVRDDRVLTYFDLRRGESKLFPVRLQAAYGGKFILPAVQCEAMYDPAVRARTAAGYTVVK